MGADTPTEPKKVNHSIDLDGVRALAEPLVNAHGLTLFEVAWTAGPAGPILRVAIERPNVSGGAAGDVSVAGVSVDDCVAVSRDLSTALDAVELIGPKYHLEVSSPGLARPMSTQRDFARQVGRLAKLRLKEPSHDGQTVLRGEVLAAGEDSVAIEVDGNRHEVRFDNIHHAKLVFELGGQKKQRRKKPRKGPSDRQRKAAGS